MFSFLTFLIYTIWIGLNLSHPASKIAETKQRDVHFISQLFQIHVQLKNNRNVNLFEFSTFIGTNKAFICLYLAVRHLLIYAMPMTIFSVLIVWKHTHTTPWSDSFSWGNGKETNKKPKLEHTNPNETKSAGWNNSDWNFIFSKIYAKAQNKAHGLNK